MSTLEDLNIFDLLRLSHISDEEKVKRLGEMQEYALLDFFTQDLPKLISQEELEEFRAIVEDKEKQLEAESWLRSHVEGFEDLLKERMLALKKALVRENMITRLDINKQEVKEGVDEQRMGELDQERETLEKILAAIESNDWDTVSNLVKTL